MQDVEALQQSESETAQDQIRDLEDSVKQLQQQLRDTESDLTRRSEELKYAEEESHRQKLSLQSRIQEREEELQKVRNQVRKKIFVRRKSFAFLLILSSNVELWWKGTVLVPHFYFEISCFMSYI